MNDDQQPARAPVSVNIELVHDCGQSLEQVVDEEGHQAFRCPHCDTIIPNRDSVVYLGCAAEELLALIKDMNPRHIVTPGPQIV